MNWKAVYGCRKMKKVLGFLFLLSVSLFSLNDACNCRLPVSGASKSLLPWSTILKEKDQMFCMGFIVDEKMIMTSADCVQSRKIKDLSVIAGATRLENVDSNKVYDVESIIVHPLYNGSKSNNIAIIKLRKAIKFEQGKVEKACLEVSYNNGYLNDELLTVAHSNQTDSFEYSYFKITERLPLEEKFLHGRSTKKDKVICKIDYGGPSMYTYRSSNLSYVVALNSFINADTNSQLACSNDVYFTRLSGYRDFIKDNVKDHC